jgi:hypothetical protein
VALDVYTVKLFSSPLVPSLTARQKLLSMRLRERFAALGMQFLFNARPVKVENSSSGARLTMKSGRALETEAALFAAAPPSMAWNCKKLA